MSQFKLDQAVRVVRVVGVDSHGTAAHFLGRVGMVIDFDQHDEASESMIGVTFDNGNIVFYYEDELEAAE